MFEATEVRQNTVSANGQLPDSSLVHIYNREQDKLRVLFVGNSITYHAPKPSIGWDGCWGMAASCIEKDYVHQTLRKLGEHYGTVSYGIAQVASWETSFDEVGEAWKVAYSQAAELQADVVVIRLGENIPSNKLETVNVKPYIEDMIDFFGKGCRQIIVTDCFWKREKLDRVFKEICEEKGYTFCELSDLYANQETMALENFEHKGVSLHPSDYGMELIATRIVQCVEDINIKKAETRGDAMDYE